MLNDLSSDESKRRAAIDLLKNADEGRDEALKIHSSGLPVAKNANEFCVNP